MRSQKSLFRKPDWFFPKGYFWTSVSIWTMHWWITIPMYLIERHKLNQKRVSYRPQPFIEGTARDITTRNARL